MNENDFLLTSLLDCRPVDLVVNKRRLSPNQESQYAQMKARKAKGEPLQYITGQCEFVGIPLFVDRRVLIPRPETEILVDRAIKKMTTMPRRHVLKALDIGVGSGNISIALLKNIVNMELTAIDISDGAIALAKENARCNGVEQRVKFVCEDMCAYFQQAIARGEKYDLVIANPPYIPENEMINLPVDVRMEPSIALNGGVDGLQFYRDIIKSCWQLLDDRGFLALEIGDGQRDGIENIFSAHCFYKQIEFQKDYVGTDRVVFAQLRNKNGVYAQWKNSLSKVSIP